MTKQRVRRQLLFNVTFFMLSSTDEYQKSIAGEIQSTLDNGARI